MIPNKHSNSPDQQLISQKPNLLQTSIRVGKAKSRAEDLKQPDILSSLIHKIGHEIGNPLTSIISMGTVLESMQGGLNAPKGKDDKRSHYTNAIIDEAWRISRLNERLVMLLSTRTGNVTGCDVMRVAERALSKLKSRHKELFKTTKLVFSVPEDYPLVAIDEMQLMLVFTELFHNAQDAVNLSSKQTSLETNATHPITIYITPHSAPNDYTENHNENFVTITFSSHSIEACQLELDSLFDPNVTGYHMHKHLGLGLTVCQAIIERAGGEIKVIEDTSNSQIIFSTEFTIPVFIDKNNAVLKNQLER